MAKKKKNKNNSSTLKKVFLLLLSIAVIWGLVFVYDLYRKVYAPNVKDHSGFNHYLYIASDATYEDVVATLVRRQIIMNEESFKWVAYKMNYPNHINPGRYYIKPKMNNRELISLLRSGEQKPVQVVIKEYRTKEQLIDYVSSVLEADSTILSNLFKDPIFLRQYGLKPESVISIFIANTYEFYWNTSASQFFERMVNEYKKFWNAERLAKAKKLGLTPLEVMTLASIVEEETYRMDENAMVAGVYLNRLKKGMRLEADPTVKFAVGDFTLKRILKEHTRHNSPYNTYRNRGLPPGPICIPSITTIDGTLDAKDHNYLYFCADASFNGYHKFASTYQQHLINARNYRAELDKRTIK